MIRRNKGKRLNQYVTDYVVFDLETTGINPNLDKIIEISAIRVIKNQAADEFSTLVNPGRPIPRGATAVNGITDEMVAGAPAIGEAMERFLEFIGDSILIGHNIHTFDMIFVCNAAFLELGREIRNDYIDTLYLARQCLPHLRHHKLTDVSDYFGIETEGAHRALCDCVMNQKCYEALGRILAETKAKTKEQGAGQADGPVCPECGSELMLRKGRYGAFYGCSAFPACRFTRKVK